MEKIVAASSLSEIIKKLKVLAVGLVSSEQEPEGNESTDKAATTIDMPSQGLSNDEQFIVTQAAKIFSDTFNVHFTKLDTHLEGIRDNTLAANDILRSIDESNKLQQAVPAIIEPLQKTIPTLQKDDISITSAFDNTSVKFTGVWNTIADIFAKNFKLGKYIPVKPEGVEQVKPSEVTVVTSPIIKADVKESDKKEDSFLGGLLSGSGILSIIGPVLAAGGAAIIAFWPQISKYIQGKIEEGGGTISGMIRVILTDVVKSVGWLIFDVLKDGITGLLSDTGDLFTEWRNAWKAENARDDFNKNRQTVADSININKPVTSQEQGAVLSTITTAQENPQEMYDAVKYRFKFKTVPEIRRKVLRSGEELLPEEKKLYDALKLNTYDLSTDQGRAAFNDKLDEIHYANNQYLDGVVGHMVNYIPKAQDLYMTLAKGNNFGSTEEKRFQIEALMIDPLRTTQKLLPPFYIAPTQPDVKQEVTPVPVPLTPPTTQTTPDTGVKEAILASGSSTAQLLTTISKILENISKKEASVMVPPQVVMQDQQSNNSIKTNLLQPPNYSFGNSYLA